MFQGCFSWDKKGPYHIWKLEIRIERKENDKELAAINTELEPILKEQQELSISFERIGLRNRQGWRLVWKWDKNHRKLERGDRNRIDASCDSKAYSFCKGIRADLAWNPYLKKMV